MFDPVSTYRIQFHKDFTFARFERIIPYLHQLGVKTVYASPIFEATPGSMHGYDVTNPLAINPEIGTLAQLKTISRKLKKLGITWLQDIVPNHMAFLPQNPWLMDVLEKGRASAYGGVFDILWDSPLHDGRLMAPFLGKTFDEAVDAGEIKIEYKDGRLILVYFDTRYPLNALAYQSLTEFAGESAGKPGSGMLSKYRDLFDKTFNDKFLTGASKNHELLRSIHKQQYYRLCHWQETDKKINYRRFFTVNGLICLNMQDEAVFNRYHVLIKTLVQQGIFQGLRVDHIDGLFDPSEYLRRLRQLVGGEIYIIVEKILEKGEEFPVAWPVQGNTGYDFLAIVNNLFTNRDAEKKLSAFYASIGSGKVSVDEQIIAKKRLILQQHMAGELDNLCRLFMDLDDAQNIKAHELKQAIEELLVRFPVYRNYGDTLPLPADDVKLLSKLLRDIERDLPALRNVNKQLKHHLLKTPETVDEDLKQRILFFYQRLMQFTGPLMAKGVEDTLMYTYNRFTDHNEVGDAPDAFGLNAGEFHKLMVNRQKQLPLSLNATSTHDTKRGEDVRARLNVLSDLANEWIAQVRSWRRLNAGLKKNNAPDANDEYLIYQTLTGAYPMPGQDLDDFPDRLGEYLQKALREAKTNTNWTTPDLEYEEAAKNFARQLLKPQAAFWRSFEPFHRRVSEFGIINSLSQLLLKYTCPGLPDLYQGSELWDLSLVDPDNRRPVDFERRQKAVDGTDWAHLWETRLDGDIKLMLTSKLLKLRQKFAQHFAEGDYVPIKVTGKYSENIFAFARSYRSEWLVSVIPLHFASITDDDVSPQDFDWNDTRILLPQGAPQTWENVFTGERDYAGKAIPAGELFKKLPVALLHLHESTRNRSAGVLLHITSLPSRFGIGDLGPEAHQFVDFLFRSRQKYWQMLPVNPVDKGSGYSPYSSTSTFAGNVLLISPELLVKEGLLTASEIEACKKDTDRVDFQYATAVKTGLFEKAYSRFLQSAEAESAESFESFKRTESWWLDDFAAYQCLKDKFNDKPWYNWPEAYKNRNRAKLAELLAQPPADRIKWLQYQFGRQWQQLRSYCEGKGIVLFGDMPFYTSYDSADVWANRDYFKLDDTGKLGGIAGVPPDYFSETGQLWGMPVYNWDKLKATGYSWWIKRINRNLQFFDLVRLDHFRAFSAYWEVPGGSKNAVNGNWIAGPGADFFIAVKKALGNLPFVAEDLGDIDEAVYELRDKFNLPGMRVLQFAFDEKMPISPHIPHNYTANSIAYTGTHDNNTATGWYKTNANSAVKKRLAAYSNAKVSAKNVAETMIRMCYASPAMVAIVPIQDILGLDQHSRMNIPSLAKGNWGWRLKYGQLTSAHERLLTMLVSNYGR